MADLKSYLVMTFLKYWNTACQTYQDLHTSATKVYSYLKDYVENRHETWIFLYGQNNPIPLNSISNTINYEWIYDNSLKTLKHRGTDTIAYKHKLPWLSARLSIQEHDTSAKNIFEIDDFINGVTIYTPEYDNNIDSIYKHIFYMWCIYSKQWFDTKSRIILSIITNTGDDLTIEINP